MKLFIISKAKEKYTYETIKQELIVNFGFKPPVSKYMITKLLN